MSRKVPDNNPNYRPNRPRRRKAPKKSAEIESEEMIGGEGTSSSAKKIKATSADTMPSYKLTYFNINGLAEPIRYLLHQSGIKFEDRRLSFDDWPQVKPEMPMGQAPVLEIDGKIYHQSRAIGRLIAKKNNFYGSNDVEAYEIDATVDTIEDLRTAFSQYQYEQDEAQKAKYKTVVDTKAPYYLEKFEEQVKKNGGYFVGGKLSWADLVYAAHSETMSKVLESDVNKDHPALKKLVDKVRALPNIKAYLDKRP